MKSKIFSIVALAFLLVTETTGGTAAAARPAIVGQHLQHGSNVERQDPISGEWNVTFHVHESRTPATFTFKLDGTTITGTAYSDHTGPGTIRDGKWADGKLSFTLDFKKHESIVVRGLLKDGRLAGEFSTEGFTEKWEASRK